MMKYSTYIIPPAQEEFRITRLWYKQLGIKGLSNRFAQSVKQTILRVKANPYAFSVRYKNIRVAHTEIFPYALHFYIDGSVIVFTAIIYQGRYPSVASGRTV